MKIVTWNCNGGFQNKFQKIAALNADIYVIQECANPEHAKDDYRQWAKNYLWVGENKGRGLGIFASSSLDIHRLNWEDNGLQWFLPVAVNHRFNLVGVWTKYANSPTFGYIGQLWKYLQLHKDKIASNSTVLCGDLNSNKIWDIRHSQGNHSDVVKELNGINMLSCYHVMTAEEQGKESNPTFYLQRNVTKPYHIDYVFASKDLFNITNNTVSVGAYSEWLKVSDHVPITFTID
jgi:endonuclease/exonuclease/phosphatase family metal-dependent hydrolase